MVRFAYLVLLFAAGVSASSLLQAGEANGAVRPGPSWQIAELSPTPLNGAADIELRFVQEDGPESGNVRVILTPLSRQLTVSEARVAAQQGFLEALNEDALGDDLRRIIVVVRLVPGSDSRGREQVIRFVRKSGRDWSVLLGDEGR
jgi:hypothetical protein